MKGTIILTCQDNGIASQTSLTDISIIDKMAALMALMQALQFDSAEIAAAQAMMTGHIEPPIEFAVAGTSDTVMVNKGFLKESWVVSKEAAEKTEAVITLAGEVEDILNGLFGDREEGGNKA